MVNLGAAFAEGPFTQLPVGLHSTVGPKLNQRFIINFFDVLYASTYAYMP